MVPFDAALQDGFRGQGRVCDTHVETKGTRTKEKKGDQFRCVVRVHVRCTTIILIPPAKCQAVQGNMIDTTSISPFHPSPHTQTMPALSIRPSPKKTHLNIHPRPPLPRPEPPHRHPSDQNYFLLPHPFFPVSFSRLPHTPSVDFQPSKHTFFLPGTPTFAYLFLHKKKKKKKSRSTGIGTTQPTPATSFPILSHLSSFPPLLVKPSQAQPPHSISPSPPCTPSTKASTSRQRFTHRPSPVHTFVSTPSLLRHLPIPFAPHCRCLNSMAPRSFC